MRIDEKLGIVVLTSHEKWDRLQLTCAKWLAKLDTGELELDHTELRSDKGLMVYVTQSYPAMKPYMKGFHLSMETWRSGRDSEGWKLPPGSREEEYHDDSEEWMEMARTAGSDEAPIVPPSDPASGRTRAVPRF